MSDIKNGDRVKHKITGFSGIVIASTEWLNGCRRLIVQAQDLHDGKPVEAQTFDEQELAVTKAAAVTVERLVTQSPYDAGTPIKRPGGHHPTPVRASGPTRR